VVFFGEGVPRPRVDVAMARLGAADALLVVGSSLMVWSGYRFVREARRLGLPAAALNLGRTRADSDLEFRVEAACGAVLQVLAERLV
jgi:NAD-dependent SIR2 family protein deacetylase